MTQTQMPIVDSILPHISCHHETGPTNLFQEKLVSGHVLIHFGWLPVTYFHLWGKSLRSYSKSAQIVGETLLLVTKCGKYHHVWWLYPHVCWSHPNLFCINTNTCLYIYIYAYICSIPPHPPMLVAWPYTTIHVLYLHAGLMPPLHYPHDTSMQGSRFTAYMPIQHIQFVYNILQPITAHTVSFSSHAAMY